MQKLRTLLRKQSWLMTSTLDGCCKVSVFPVWACKVSFISYWAYYCIFNYGARRNLKSCYCLSGFSISSSNYVFEQLIIRFYVFNWFAFMSLEAEHACFVPWIGSFSIQLIIRFYLCMIVDL